MRYIKFFLLLALSTSVHAVYSQNEKFVRTVNCFSLKLLQKLKPEKGNIFMSPFSVAAVLNMVMLGARGKTAKQLNEVLQNKIYNLTNDDIKQGFESFIKRITSYDDFDFSMANAMWTDQSYTVNDDYKKVMQDTFTVDQRSGDFKGDPAKATDDINAWVKEKTNSMIDKLFDKPLDSSTIMLLLNANYFKGVWKLKFFETNTIARNFYNGGDKNKVSEVRTLFHVGRYVFNYHTEIKLKTLRLDYDGERMSFVAFLPDEGVSLADVEKNVGCHSIYRLLNFHQRIDVSVQIPKLQITSETDLKDTLKALGLETVFEKGDLSGIGTGDLKLSKIAQKAKFVVDEEGTEVPESDHDHTGESPVTFWAKRPFSYFIVDSDSGLILFGGYVTGF